MKLGRNFLIAIIALAPVVNAAGADAHTVLIKSNPAVGSQLGALPDSISLTFADDLLSIKGKVINTISVLDPMKAQVASKPSVTGKVLSATLNESMKMNGDFLVAYRVVAQDGHVVTGNFKFSVDASHAMKTEKVKSITSGIRSYEVTANGSNSLISGDKGASATGKFSIDFSKNTFCYRITAKNLSKITGAHIHAIMVNNRVSSVQDEVFIGLDAKNIIGGKESCMPVDNQSLSAIGANPDHYFLMIHTEKYPDGAIGGVLKTIKG